MLLLWQGRKGDFIVVLVLILCFLAQKCIMEHPWDTVMVDRQSSSIQNDVIDKTSIN